MSTNNGTRYETATAAMICNGLQKGADGEPAFSMWTLDWPGHVAHGATWDAVERLALARGLSPVVQQRMVLIPFPRLPKKILLIMC